MLNKDVESTNSLSGDRLLTETEVADRLGVKVATLRKRRLLQRPPAYHKIGRSVRYAPSDVEQFLAGQRIEPRRSA
jgi:predicted DNA-binding transcriptional regulator AlpA